LQGAVTWQALLLLVSATIIANVSCALFVGWLVYKVCGLVGTIEKRLQRLEILSEGRK
jgi:hypothetical protein